MDQLYSDTSDQRRDSIALSTEQSSTAHQDDRLDAGITI